MGAIQIKKELYNYIEEADERLLKMLYAVAKEYNQEEYILPGEPMNEEDFKKRVVAAKSRISAGQYTTQEELEKEMKKW
jgi:hypothetical protein